MTEQREVEVAGRRLVITSSGKVFFAEARTGQVLVLDAPAPGVGWP